jgi:hypothetical protein
VVKKLPVTVQRTRVPLVVNFFYEPPEGKYDYEAVLPAGRIAGLNVSLAEVRAVFTGLTLLLSTATTTRSPTSRRRSSSPAGLQEVSPVRQRLKPLR